MPKTYTFVEDLAKEIEIPSEGILTRTRLEDDYVKTVLFGFSAGQELSEHTATKAATLYFVSGEATVRLGEQEHHARAGTWIHMTPDLKHAIRAETPVAMLLVLLKK